MSRPFDIIVYGATGFTGILVAEYLTTNSTVAFAIAGRSQTKLQDVAKQLKKLKSERFGSEGVPIIVADSSNQKSIDEMVAKGKVVITTVGPYDKYGYELVDACVRIKTDYVDLTGEPQFIRKIIDKYHDTAVKNNVLIVNSCGFDSIPSDLGTLLIADYFKTKGLKTNSVRLTVKAFKGTASGGTIASMCNMIDSMKLSELKEMVGNPDYLAPNSVSNGKVWNGTTMYYDKGLRIWQTPFIMESTNLRLVRRSNALLDYGSTFQYCEGTSSKNVVYAAFLTFIMSLGAVLLFFPPIRYAIQKFMPPGSGPSEELRKNGFFDIRLYGDAMDTQGNLVGVRGRVHSNGDPGYAATSKMIAESALCLLEKSKFKQSTFPLLKGGVVTPASAMGMNLVDRLRKAEMTLEIQE
jgi:short subunit dehydrogenase-like uncharacterized protein